MPMIRVFKGTIELIIDATELSISVSANANRKAGKKLPKNAEMVIHFHSNFFIVNIFFHAIKKIITDENIILSDPNCEASRPTKAFFISIKELPQISERRIK
tara:strand:+ start:1351 stop:1656 length:306 start_codon:yes stop_codon:yes gene_type:complete